MNRHKSVTAALVFLASSVAAQTPTNYGPEVRPFIGAYMPAGAIRNEFNSAPLLGLQAAYEPTRHLHVVGTLGFMRNRVDALTISDDAMNVFLYDAGLEFNHDRMLGADWMFRPFLGAGVGGRTYDYSASGISSSTCGAGYAATGAQMQRSALAWRVEARGYLACYESPVTAQSKTRNDYTISFGAVWHFR